MVDSDLLSRDGHGSANSLRPPDEAVVSVIRTTEELKEALHIRQVVFVEGQNVPLDEEIDAYDGGGDPQKVAQDVVHVLAHMNGKAVGTGRLLINPPIRQLPKAQRIAVLDEAQGKGVGRRIMLSLQEQAWARGFRGVVLDAQLKAIPFYEKLGYKVMKGDVFLDAGIEHRKMELVFGGGASLNNE